MLPYLWFVCVECYVFMHITGVERFLTWLISLLFLIFSVILSAGLLNWSLISLISLVASLIFRFTYTKTGNFVCELEWGYFTRLIHWDINIHLHTYSLMACSAIYTQWTFWLMFSLLFEFLIVGTFSLSFLLYVLQDFEIVGEFYLCGLFSYTQHLWLFHKWYFLVYVRFWIGNGPLPMLGG